MYEFITIVLEGIQRIDDSNGKRTSDQWSNTLYRSLDRIILFKLSEIDPASTEASVIIEILEKLIYHQKVIFSPLNTDLDFLKCLCYHLYKFLLNDHQEVKTNSTSVSFPLIHDIIFLLILCCLFNLFFDCYVVLPLIASVMFRSGNYLCFKNQ